MYLDDYYSQVVWYYVEFYYYKRLFEANYVVSIRIFWLLLFSSGLVLRGILILLTK